MVKLTFCLRRRSDLTREEFSRYWAEVHGPLVAARAEVLRIRRYVQVHTAEAPDVHAGFQRRNGSPPPYDGVAELWFDDIDDIRPSSPAARAAAAELLEDERSFIDLAASPMWLGTERIVVESNDDRLPADDH